MARPETLEMIARFISIDTVSRNSNLDLVEFVRSFLEGCGAEISLTHDDAGRKANLLATIGPRNQAGIVLSGHTDVVPVDGEDWTSNPFTLVQRDGRLFGRGVCDMKGFLAIATAAIPRLVAEGLEAPIHIAMSYDEEVGCLGVHRLIDDIRARVAPPRCCIVGEPTGMGTVHAHKGKVGGHVAVRGLGAHSSLSHRGVNAVEAAGEAIAFLKRLQRKLRREGPYSRAFEAPDHTSIQCCMVSGGTAVNVVPAAAAFDFEIRYLPGEDPEAYMDLLRAYIRDELEPEMKAVHSGTGFAWTTVPGCAAYWQEPDSQIVSLVRELSPVSGLFAVPFGTEAGYFVDAGIPTVVCGPGSIDQAHKPDEYLALDQVAACEAFIDGLIRRVA